MSILSNFFSGKRSQCGKFFSCMVHAVCTVHPCLCVCSYYLQHLVQKLMRLLSPFLPGAPGPSETRISFSNHPYVASAHMACRGRWYSGGFTHVLPFAKDFQVRLGHATNQSITSLSLCSMSDLRFCRTKAEFFCEYTRLYTHKVIGGLGPCTTFQGYCAL